MPYAIRKLPNRNEFEVYNKITRKIHAKHTSLPKALAQLRILHKGTGVSQRPPSVSTGRGFNKENSLSDKQIIEILHKNGKNINGILSKDLLPHQLKNGWYIINLQSSSDGNGTHWTCFKYYDDKPLFYMDSMGFEPPVEVEKHTKNNILFSSKQIQDYDSTACGYFCIGLILSDNGSNIMNNFTNYINRFSSNTIFNDEILKNLLHELRG